MFRSGAGWRTAASEKTESASGKKGKKARGKVTRERGRTLKVDFSSLLEAGKHASAKGWVSLG